MKFLGLDLGTSFLKGAVLDLERGEIGSVVRRPFPPALADQPARHVGVDPAAIVAAGADLLDELAAQAPDAAGIVLCAQMHGMVLTDGAGRALSPAITWQDQRILDPLADGTGTLYDRLTAQIAPEQVAATGNGLKPSLPLCTLVWQRSQGLLPDGAIPVSLGDYLPATLARQRAVVEPTTAAAMGLLDLTTRQWAWGLIDQLGLGGLDWPTVVDLSAPAYEIVLRGRTLPCWAAVGDHQCSLLGALLGPDELSINISTGSQVGVLAPSFVPGKYESRPFFDGGFLQAVTRIPAGRALNALVDLLGALALAEGYQVQHAWQTVAAAVDATPTTDLEADISFFAGVVGERGHLANLSEENLKLGHLFRAAFRTMARNYAICAQHLSPPQPWQRLVLSGGLAQNFGALRDEIAAEFQLPYRQCPTSEDSLLGLLALATYCAGRAPSVAAAVAGLQARFN
jgi:sugar (pentulose or hexulose) kinase